jgi:ElaB/YqjD/DUF883 family membrane-anchored ribosome-binding protein
MADMNKDDAARPTTPGTARSGSDTASAANISAGTSVGNAGQPAMPQQFSGSSGSAGSPSQGAGQSNRAQGGGPSDTASDLRERAADTLDQASDWARDQYERGARQLDQARDQSMRQLRQASGSIERFVSENPLMVGVIGLAAGLVIGALLPRTRPEDRAFGQWADQVRDQGMRYAREAAQRGREYVEEALGSDTEDERGEWRREDEGRGIRSSGPRYQNH